MRLTQITRAFRTFVPLALVLMAGSVFAGPLAPSSGPVTSTMKTLSEVEPRTAINSTNTPGDANSAFKITTPGSYYLTGDLVVLPGKHGILVTSGTVSIDLNGYRIYAFGSASTAIRGTGSDCVTVRNGFVRGPFSVRAVLTNGPALVEDLDIAAGSIGTSGDPTTIRRCRIVTEDLDAISLTSGGSAGIIEDCQIIQSNPLGSGIFSNLDTTTIRRCNIVAPVPSSGKGILAIIQASGTPNVGQVVEDCTVRGFATGIATVAGCAVKDCTVINAPTAGIAPGSGSLVEGNRLLNCGIGVNLQFTSGCTVMGNRFRTCTTPIGTPAGNDVAPTGTAAASTNPHANIVN